MNSVLVQSCLEQFLGNIPGLGLGTLCLVGCTAEIKQLQWQSDGSCHAVARGLQRFSIDRTSINPREPYTLMS